ncbi:MAG: hypothetical protein H7A18_06100 [Sinobacteraceae bacterium]|nr:hypothetical protein [Nevskiaceae bacterium]MCP5466235.1 hypothetical protein [Nevskiaceae bacterium]MCP5471637.1 hypothetical protein [Nevskiaceae bacterium]
MDHLEFWRWIHVLLFVFWLGADVGVFVCGSWMRRESLSDEQRLVLLQASAVVDLWPRFSAALMLPVGLMLAQAWNPQLPASWIVIGWIVALAWLALTLLGMRYFDQPLGAKLRQITNLFLIGLAIACFWGGASWLQSAEMPFAWLATKLLLYGVVCLLAIGIDLAFRPVLGGFALLSVEARRVEANRLIRSGMNRTLIVVGMLYAVLIAASVLGIAKPF